MHVDERHPRLRQPAGQQAALAKLRGPIHGTDAGGLGRQMKSPRRGRRTEQVERLAMKRIEGTQLGSVIHVPALGLDLLQKPAARGQPHHRHVRVGGQGIDADVGRHQILIDGQGAVALAQKAGRLPVQNRAVVAPHLRTDLHPRRQGPRTTQPAQHRTERRKIVGRGREVSACLSFRRMGMARHGAQAGLDMIGIGMAQRTNDCQLVCQPGRTRQQFADANARHAGGNGPKLASGRRRSIGLGVPRLLLGVAAVKIQHDHRTSLTERPRRAGRSRARLGPQEIRQGQRQPEGAAKTQHFPSIDSICTTHR